MAKFGDLDQYWDPGLTLTVLGKEYTLPLPSAEMGLWCRRMVSAGQLSSDSTDEEIQAEASKVAQLPALPGDLTMEERLLGDAYLQMMADKVPDPFIQFCTMTAYIWIVGGEDMAQRYWEAGGRPEARGPDNRAERRANARKTSTAAASATSSQGSTSGTSSQPRSGGTGRARRSRGRRS